MEANPSYDLAHYTSGFEMMVENLPKNEIINSNKYSEIERLKGVLQNTSDFERQGQR